MSDAKEKVIDNKLPDYLEDSTERKGYQRILDSFTERGEKVNWTPSGPKVDLNGYEMDVSFCFMYPSVFNL